MLRDAYFPKGMLSFLGKSGTGVQIVQGFHFSCDTISAGETPSDFFFVFSLSFLLP